MQSIKNRGAGHFCTNDTFARTTLLHEETLLHEGSFLHEGTLLHGGFFARRVTFARRLFCTRGNFCTKGHFYTRGHFCTATLLHVDIFHVKNFSEIFAMRYFGTMTFLHGKSIRLVYNFKPVPNLYIKKNWKLKFYSKLISKTKNHKNYKNRNK